MRLNNQLIGMLHSVPCHSFYTAGNLHDALMDDFVDPSRFATAWSQELVTSYIYTLHHYVNWISSGVFLSREESQQVFEVFYTSHFIPMLLQLMRDKCSTGPKSAMWNMKTVSQWMNICSELVLTSSKFLQQVNFFPYFFCSPFFTLTIISS